MVLYAAECSSSALLTWNEPVATDNSGHVSISYPTIRPPVNLSVGLHNLRYSAIDNNENQAFCTFIVLIKSKSSHLPLLIKTNYQKYNITTKNIIINIIHEAFDRN